MNIQKLQGYPIDDGESWAIYGKFCYSSGGELALRSLLLPTAPAPLLLCGIPRGNHSQQKGTAAELRYLVYGNLNLAYIKTVGAW